MANVLNSLIGNSSFKSLLERLLEHQSLSHAVLISGPESIGKSTAVRLIVAHLMQTDRLENHPDVLFLRRAKADKEDRLKNVISVDQMRDLINRFVASPLSADKKIAIIEEAEKMHPSAANALLKTLEEPRGNSHLFLMTNDEKKIFETIRSRCQIFRLKVVEEDEIVEAMVKKGIAPSDAKEAAQFSLGSPGLALRYIEDSMFKAQIETAAISLEKLLNVSLSEKLSFAHETVQKKNGHPRETVENLFNCWESVLRKLMLENLGNSLKAIKYRDLLEVLLESRNRLSRNLNPQVALEHLLIKL